MRPTQIYYPNLLVSAIMKDIKTSLVVNLFLKENERVLWFIVHSVVVLGSDNVVSF